MLLSSLIRKALIAFCGVVMALPALACPKMGGHDHAHHNHFYPQFGYQKPGAPVRIIAPEFAQLDAGKSYTFDYRLRTERTGAEMAVTVVYSLGFERSVQRHALLAEDAEAVLSLDVLAPTDGAYQINIFVEMDGLMRTLAHRFHVGEKPAKTADCDPGEGRGRHSHQSHESQRIHSPILMGKSDTIRPWMYQTLSTRSTMHNAMRCAPPSRISLYSPALAAVKRVCSCIASLG